MKRNRGNRNYSHRPVPEDSLVKILEAGAAAPSGVVNGVHIYVVDDSEMRQEIHSICVQTEKEWIGDQPTIVQEQITSASDYDPGLEFLNKAPALLVVSTRPQDPEIPYAVEVAFMAIGYMIVMAKGLGLNASPFVPSVLHEKDADRLNSLFNMPVGESIQILLPVGYPASSVNAEKRTAIKNVFHNEYGKKYFS